MARNKISKTFVFLKPKDVKDAKKVNFELSIANQLLSLSNSQWELSDEKFNWNGTEISKAKEEKS